ncbi:MAG TPA: hypothetical protein VN317_02275 [Candidatus Methanoperedens sp.]|nr:hypothetical protein [Candidatus Methanoperedens sp.]
MKKRSFAALRMRSRQIFGSSVSVGYATPFTRGVSLNCSMPTEMFGVPGICAGSQNGSVWYCQLVGLVIVMPVTAPFAPTEAMAAAPVPSPDIATATSGSVHGLLAQFGKGPK